MTKLCLAQLTITPLNSQFWCFQSQNSSWGEKRAGPEGNTQLLNLGWLFITTKLAYMCKPSISPPLHSAQLTSVLDGLNTPEFNLICLLSSPTWEAKTNWSKIDLCTSSCKWCFCMTIITIINIQHWFLQTSNCLLSRAHTRTHT